ncbi:MAG: hypothetical protein ABSB79_11180 [Syntrophales bacterium]|jgi:hypothetical protein
MSTAYWFVIKAIKVIPVIFLFCTLLFAIPSNTSAGMLAMSDTELNSVTGAGFSSFTFNPTTGVAEADFSIVAEGYWQISSMKMGYWNPGSGLGWDQNWMNVSFGTPSTDIILKNFFIQATFTNFNSPSSRQLTSFELGFKNVVSGQLSGIFNSLSRIGYAYRSGSPTTQTFNPTSFSFVIAPAGSNKGIWTRF